MHGETNRHGTQLFVCHLGLEAENVVCGQHYLPYVG